MTTAHKIASNAWIHTPNRSIDVDGTPFAYRHLGPSDGVPLLFLNHWGANLDNFDPRILDGLAEDRPVYALDYRGVGKSGGEVALTVANMAKDVVAVARALGLPRFDLAGFSLGGFVAQQTALLEPSMVRKLILTGTGPAGGVGIEQVGPVSWPLIVKGLLTLRDPKTYLFFTSSVEGRRAAKAFLARLKERVVQRDRPVTPRMFLRQLQAIKAWGQQPPQDLSRITQPTFIANGDADIMVPSENSADMAHRIPGAVLALYPDAGHGGIFQYHEQFVASARAFLAK